MIEFEIPDSRNLTPRNIKFLELMKKYPEMFYDDFKIVNAYGCPEGSIWNGGRYNPGDYSNNMVKELIDIYKSYDINFAFTFTNLLLEEKHLYDVYSNMIASLGNREGNSVISSTRVMTDYIKNNYKNYKIIESITQNLSFEEVDKRSENYLTVVPCKFNKDFELLKEFIYPENLMILTNEPCIDNCPYKASHYINTSKLNLYMTDLVFECRSLLDSKSTLFKELDKQNHTIHRYELNKYLEIGINKFKISGRCDEQEISLRVMLDLMVRPEFMEFIKTQVTLITNQDWNWNWVTLFKDAI